jgi:hypothetical protein
MVDPVRRLISWCGCKGCCRRDHLGGCDGVQVAVRRRADHRPRTNQFTLMGIPPGGTLSAATGGWACRGDRWSTQKSPSTAPAPCTRKRSDARLRSAPAVSGVDPAGLEAAPGTISCTALTDGKRQRVCRQPAARSRQCRKPLHYRNQGGAACPRAAGAVVARPRNPRASAEIGPTR